MVSFYNPSGFVKTLWHDAAKHLYRLLFNVEYRRFFWLVAKYGRTPRYRQRNIRVQGWNLIVPDVASFFSAYREIFIEQIYAFPSASKAPVVLDCGANIGVSILYFKKLYPSAKVIAYEADPTIFGFLQANMQKNDITDVELHNVAIWSSEMTVEFNVEGADGGRINVGNDRNVIAVQAISLESVVQQHKFDFIKLDIEGAETDALAGSMKYLDRVPFVFVEFHSFQGKKQKLGKLINDFERLGFRVHVHPPFTQKTPFMGMQDNMGMDMQLNLFFWKGSNETP